MIDVDKIKDENILKYCEFIKKAKEDIDSNFIENRIEASHIDVPEEIVLYGLTGGYIENNKNDN